MVSDRGDEDVEHLHKCVICWKVLNMPARLSDCHHPGSACCLRCLRTIPTRPVCRLPINYDLVRVDDELEHRVLSTRFRCECGSIVPLTRWEARGQTCRDRLRARQAQADGHRRGSHQPLFTCPLCLKGQLDQDELRTHILTDHAQTSPRRGACPICCVQLWADPGFVSPDLVAHMRKRHGFDPTSYLPQGDWDEEQMMETTLRTSRTTEG